MGKGAAMSFPERLSSARAFIPERSEGRAEAILLEDKSSVWRDRARLEELSAASADVKA